MYIISIILYSKETKGKFENSDWVNFSTITYMTSEINGKQSFDDHYYAVTLSRDSI